MESNRRKLKVGICLLLAIYIIAYVVVHRSSTLRKPAGNMAYWYYSDNPTIENIEFYGFWPLRQVGYQIPGLNGRHNLERRKPVFDFDKSGF